MLDKDKVRSRLVGLLKDYLKDLDDDQIYRARVEVRHLIQDLDRGYLDKDW